MLAYCFRENFVENPRECGGESEVDGERVRGWREYGMERVGQRESDGDRESEVNMQD